MFFSLACRQPYEKAERLRLHNHNNFFPPENGTTSFLSTSVNLVPRLFLRESHTGGGGGGSFHSKGTQKGIRFWTSSLAKGMLFGNFSQRTVKVR